MSVDPHRAAPELACPVCGWRYVPPIGYAGEHVPEHPPPIPIGNDALVLTCGGSGASPIFPWRYREHA